MTNMFGAVHGKSAAPPPGQRRPMGGTRGGRPNTHSSSAEDREKARIQTAFNSFYWRENYIIDRPLQRPVPNTITTNTDPSIQNNEITIEPKLLPMQKEKDGLTPAEHAYYYAIRPGFGTKKPTDSVLTNHFTVALPSRIWRYEISGFPGNATRQKKKVMVNIIIYCAPFLSTHRAHFAYDGNEMIFAWMDLFAGLPDDQVENMGGEFFEVEVHEIPSARTANGQNELRSLKLRTGARHGRDFQQFMNAISGNALTTPTIVGAYVTILNTIISKADSDPKQPQFETFQLDANNFFLRQSYQTLGPTHSSLLQTHVGFFSAIKPGMGVPLLNLNIATSAFYQPLRVSEYMDRVVMPVNQEIERRNAKGLKGIRVYIDYLRGEQPKTGRLQDLPVNQPGSRVRTIFEIETHTVAAQTFDKEGENQPVRLTDYLLQSKYLHKTCTHSS
jgi:hypothetical protein